MSVQYKCTNSALSTHPHELSSAVQASRVSHVVHQHHCTIPPYKANSDIVWCSVGGKHLGTVVLSSSHESVEAVVVLGGCSECIVSAQWFSYRYWEGAVSA
jgi:hypothetical protein